MAFQENSFFKNEKAYFPVLISKAWYILRGRNIHQDKNDENNPGLNFANIDYSPYLYVNHIPTMTYKI